jgi:apolipoprotein D and lipocalin family protein
MNKLFLSIAALFISGCLGMPESVVPVKDFELNKYLGKWYEIARLDHSFERGLEKVTAEYSLREGGGILVKNRGFYVKKNRWTEAEGKAFFIGEPNEGYLKVSFFGPFYTSYVIFELDKENYHYAFISGKDTSYLWLLSRTPTVDEDLLIQFSKKAKKLGFNTEQLIFVNHN